MALPSTEINERSSRSAAENQEFCLRRVECEMTVRRSDAAAEPAAGWMSLG